jgi:hypothetical protein
MYPKEFTDASGKIDEQKVREAASKIVVVERGSRLQPRQDFQDNEFDMMKKSTKKVVFNKQTSLP